MNNRPLGIGDFLIELKEATFKGDSPGHPFRGNQYNGGMGNGEDGIDVPKKYISTARADNIRLSRGEGDASSSLEVTLRGENRDKLIPRINQVMDDPPSVSRTDRSTILRYSARNKFGEDKIALVRSAVFRAGGLPDKLPGDWADMSSSELDDLFAADMDVSK